MWLYFAFINIVAFGVFGLDKHRAAAGRRRIPELNLHLLGLLGGVAGGWLGMALFRHKTRKLRFRLVFFLVSLLFCAALYLIGTRAEGFLP